MLPVISYSYGPSGRTKWPKWKQRQNFIFLHLASDYNGLGLRLKIQLLQLIYENVRSWCTWSIFKFETAGCSVQLIRKYYIVAFNGLLTHRVIAFQSQFSQERMRWAWHGVGRNQLPKNSPFQTWWYAAKVVRYLFWIKVLIRLELNVSVCTKNKLAKLGRIESLENCETIIDEKASKKKWKA